MFLITGCYERSRPKSSDNFCTEGRRALPQEIFDDLRQYIEACKRVAQWREIKGADWNLEIGTIIEATAERITPPPLLIFDEIKGYPSGYRVLGLSFANYKRVALALGLSPEKSKLELIRLAARKISSAQPIPPQELSSPPV